MIIRGCTTRQILYNTVEQGCKYNLEESFSQFSICAIPGAHNDNEEKEGKGRSTNCPRGRLKISPRLATKPKREQSYDMTTYPVKLKCSYIVHMRIHTLACIIDT